MKNGISSGNFTIALQWRHNVRDGVSNHQPNDCVLNRLFRRRSKKLRVTGLCAGNSPATGEFPAQMASNAENVSIWWRHHGVNALRWRELNLRHVHRKTYTVMNLSNIGWVIGKKQTGVINFLFPHLKVDNIILYNCWEFVLKVTWIFQWTPSKQWTMWFCYNSMYQFHVHVYFSLE